MDHTILSIFDEESYLHSIAHRNVHKCGSYPFNHGNFLHYLVKNIKARHILEIGTGVGYSALCLAKNNNTHVNTIDLNKEHLEIARKLWRRHGVENLIEIEIVDSESFLNKNKDTFEIVFVDAFAPNPDEVAQYLELIGNGGVLVSSNHNWNKTTPEFIAKLSTEESNYQLLGESLIYSKDPETLKSCVDLWTSTIDTTL